MISATAALGWPSTVSWPAKQVIADAASVQLELMTVGVKALGFAQPFARTYQRGSPAASRNLSVPIVFHGKRPTAGKLQLPLVMPSFAPPTFPAGSGQGKAPGLFSPLTAAWCAT